METLKLNPITLDEVRNVLASSGKEPKLLDYLLATHGFSLKPQEKEDLKVLVEGLTAAGLEVWESAFHYGTNTPAPISDEFDMFYSDDSLILNIDFKDNQLKHGPVKSVDAILKDVLEKFLRQDRLIKTFKEDRTVINMALYVSDDETRYFELSQDDDLMELTIDQVVDIFNTLNTGKRNNELGELNAGDFILSPVTSPREFVKKRYWLTKDQNDIVTEIANMHSNESVYGVEGTGGSGKTMIAFDLILKWADLRKLYVFVGTKKPGYTTLEEIIPNLKIVGAKEFENIDFIDYDVVLIDEAQRSFQNVRIKAEEAIKLAKSGDLKKVVVFYHIRQALSKKDFGPGIRSLLADRSTKFTLTDSIRSNENISAFVDKLFDLSYTYKKGITNESIAKHVIVRYFSDYGNAEEWLDQLHEEGFQLLEAVPEWNRSQKFWDSKVTTDVIGEDIDKVAVALDSSFKYEWVESKTGSKKKGANMLSHDKKYTNHYRPLQSLYVNLSRAKSKLAIAIIDNPEMMEAMGTKIFKVN